MEVIEKEKDKVIKEFKVVKEKDNKISSTLVMILIAFICIMLLLFFIFAFVNANNENITPGIFIKGVNVSGLSKEKAIGVVSEYIEKNKNEELLLKYKEFETSISLRQIEAKFDVISAVNKAYEIGRESNMISNTLKVMNVMIFNIDIEPILNINAEELQYALEDIETKLPDTVIQSSYYIDGNDLIITKGKEGVVIDINETSQYILDEIKNIENFDKVVEIITYIKQPDAINIEQIHEKIYKEPVDAYHTREPFSVYPHENGMDFNISIEEAKEILKEDKEEYTIPIKTTYPNITTNMIGSEAFPDLISSFSTKYSASNKNRTINLQLAARKINGTVLMPGEEFSYNTIVGKRTIDEGYKEAAMYLDGEVTDGLAGGICQISSTLYNAVLYANLEIIERRNHMFIPSYVGAGRDATVVYGTTDFKFKNNRNYPIKIVSYVDGGVAKFELYGLRQENDYEVELKTTITSRIPYSTKYVSRAGVRAGKVIQGGVNGTKSETYKILKQNGQMISMELLSKDTYKAMDKLIAK